MDWRTIRAALIGAAAVAAAPASPQVRAVLVDRPPAAGSNSRYVGDRRPLLPAPLIKLPVGAVRSNGWLKAQLALMADGMTGRLEEISPWCRFEGSAWSDPTGRGQYGWEELPYWLKGYTDLGYVLGDQRIMRSARRWLEAILASQRPDGYFGPEDNRARPDLWPNMLALAALRSHFEATDDQRVLPFMLSYFRWQAALPPGRFLPDSWQHWRGADNLEVIYWLYARSGEPFLLELARRNHERTADWTRGIPSWHGVNMAQGFREPAQYYQQSLDVNDLRAATRSLAVIRSRFGQVPGGAYGADENARPAYNGPRQGTETCTLVELMYSHEELLRISGDASWADRCEEVALNSFAPSMTPDLKALHYLTAPNQVRLDRANKAPMIQNGGDMMSYTPYEQYRCCQHNVAFGWPYYAERLWMATRDNGLAATLYAASGVSATVGNGTRVRLIESTQYPFSDRIAIRIEAGGPVAFPLYLRVPGWCTAPALSVNGRRADIAREPAGADATARARWLVISRTWRPGDTVALRLPMRVAVTRWPGNRNTASVSRGPLTYSLRIGEEWRKVDTGRSWPGFEVWPTSAWNYGLVLDAKDPTRGIRPVAATGTRRPGAPSDQPFCLENAPVALTARARRIPEWTIEPNGMVGEVRPSPVRSSAPIETVTLVPMGCARLRISAFPVIGSGAAAAPWGAGPPGPTASWCNPGDTVSALTDGVIPASSADTQIPRFTWWDHAGTQEWAEISTASPRVVSSCEVYWFDDEPVGGRCRTPVSWRLLWWDGKGWAPVAAPAQYGLDKDRFNRIGFPPVRTTRLRLEVVLRPGFSGGILEWRVGQ